MLTGVYLPIFLHPWGELRTPRTSSREQHSPQPALADRSQKASLLGGTGLGAREALAGAGAQQDRRSYRARS